MAKGVLSRLEALGHNIFYVTLSLFGLRGAYVLLGPVIFTYVLCSWKIHRRLRPYLSRRFPDHGRLHLWWDAFRIVYSFGQVLIDRAWLGRKKNAGFEGEFIGGEQLQSVIDKGNGLVLLTAHVGNWQAALANITGLGTVVHALMHYEQEAVAKHFFDLRGHRPFNIIRSDGFMGGLVEATAALQRGEVVTIMGDRYLGGPYASVDFLGHPVRLPVAAFSMAASTGAAVAVLLSAKQEGRRFQSKIWAVWQPKRCDRDNRHEEMERLAQSFAAILENYLEEHPYQWYSFFDFWQQ